MEDSRNKNKLEQELIEVRRKIQMLDIIENKLFQMKVIAEYVKDNSLSLEEIEELNVKIKKLKNEIQYLEKQI